MLTIFLSLTFSATASLSICVLFKSVSVSRNGTHWPAVVCHQLIWWTWVLLSWMRISRQRNLKAVNKNEKEQRFEGRFIFCLLTVMWGQAQDICRRLQLRRVMYNTTDDFNRFRVKTDLMEQCECSRASRTVCDSVTEECGGWIYQSSWRSACCHTRPQV